MDIRVKGIDYDVQVGDKFNRLTIDSFCRVTEGSEKRTRLACLCTCDCGNKVGPITLRRVVGENDKSCGCLNRENTIKRNYKHGLRVRDDIKGKYDQLYNTWIEIHRRCSATHRKSSNCYALKGITVCDAWDEYLPFKEWALNNGFEYDNDLSIERKDNSKGYCPENCTWIPMADQAKNKTNNVYLEYNGERHYVSEWARLLGISPSTIFKRLKAGCSDGEALGFE